jgi:hypothetical protein
MTSIPRRHRFTVEEYYRVAGRGLARAGPKVELIDGAIALFLGDPHRRFRPWVTTHLQFTQ